MQSQQLIKVFHPRSLARILLHLEWVWIAVMIFAFWHISPPIRDQYVFLLAGAIPIYGVRYIVHGRFFTRTPLDILLIAFALLTIYNFNNAPLSRAEYWVLVCRPFLGIFMIWYFAEHARHHQHMRYLTTATIGLGFVIGLVALTASQWDLASKSGDFRFIIDYLPRLDHKQVLPDMQLSFNPNEIAGTLAYLCPFLFAIALKSFRIPSSHSDGRFDAVLMKIERWGAVSGFIITFGALFLGQSRFALAGALVGIFIIIIFVLPTWKFRLIGLSVWGLIVALELLLVLNIFPIDLSQSVTDTSEPSLEQATGLNNRDQYSISSRIDMWERAIWMMRDYPLTGAGMSTYRGLVTREAYQIPSYVQRGTRPPHAHNAFLQVGADLGIGGLLIFVGWYAIIAIMAVRVIKNENLNSIIMTIAITSSILSYMGYGIGDTITLWDRFSFIHWWFIALMVALYTIENQAKVDT